MPDGEVAEQKTQLEGEARPLAAELETIGVAKEIRQEDKRLAKREVELYVPFGAIVCKLIDGRIIPYGRARK